MANTATDEADWGANGTLCVGVDDGFNNTKIALPTGQVLLRPSRAAVGHSRTMALGRAPSQSCEYTTQGQTYHIDGVNGSPTRHDDYPTSALNRVIVHHTLHAAGLSGQALDIVSGLPVRMYFVQGGKVTPNDVLIQAKRGSLSREVSKTDAAPIHIQKQQVLPEGFAAWFDYIIEAHGDHVSHHADRERHPVAIIDIGGRTTDYAVIADRNVQINQSGSVNIGMLDVRERLGHLIREAHDLDQVPNERTLDHAFTRKSVRLFSCDHDVKPLIHQACNDVLAQIKNEAMARIGKGAELERIIFIGGGTQAMGTLIDGWFPHQVTAQNPIYANARGMLKYAKYVIA